VGKQLTQRVGCDVMNEGSSRAPISDAHAKLGEELRRARIAAGKTTRNIPGFSSGHISNVENGYAKPSRELVDMYIGFGGSRRRLLGALEEVTRVVEAKRAAARRARHGSDLEETQPAITEQSSPLDIRATYAVDTWERFMVLDNRGVMSEISNIVTVRAVRPGAHLFVGSTSYDADKRPGVETIEPGFGCEIAQLKESDLGYVEFVLRFGRTLQPTDKESFTFSYIIRVHSDNKMAPFFQVGSRTRVGNHLLRVKFSPPALPEKIWWFRCANYIEVEQDPAPEQILNYSSNHLYFRDFQDVEGEYVGLSWYWKD
jgi:hypothetical protein